VADTGGGRRLGGDDGAVARSDSLTQEREVAYRAYRLDATVGEQGETRGVIAPVFESFEPAKQELLARPFSHVSDDSAHA
jgi:hypothetical protein